MADESATPVQIINPDITHPLRQKDVIREVKARLPKNAQFNQYDVQSIKNVYSILENESLAYSPKFTSTQYSFLFIDWIESEYHKNNNFFEETRNEYRKIKGVTGY